MTLGPEPMFLVGAPRSGTSLLRDLLRSHPQLSIPHETHFIPFAWRVWGEVRGEADALRLGGLLVRHPAVVRWGLEGPVSFDGRATFAEVLAALYEAYAERAGKTAWGDKTPQYVEQLPLLSHLFPRARFLHIVRDGRDVAISWMRHPFGNPEILSAARSWQRFVAAGRRDGALLGDRYREIRYEALITEPEQTLRGVLDWAGLPFTPAVLRRSALERFPGSAQQDLADEIAVQTNHGKWRARMNTSDVRLFEGIAGPLLLELGYEVSGTSLQPSALRRGAAAVHGITSWLLGRLDPRKRSRIWAPFLWELNFRRIARRRPSAAGTSQ